MAIERLGTFFMTHLTTDYPSVCNTLTNLAFAPLQHLIGQKNYQSLNGRVYDLSTAPPQAPATLLRPAWKTIVVIAAFFLAIPLTPCGILTRYLSFLSVDINISYWSIFILTAPANDRYKFINPLDDRIRLTVIMHLQAIVKQREFDQHLDLSITFLKELLQQLKGMDRDTAERLLDEASTKPQYPYPFQLAEKLTSNPLRQIPNPVLLKQFESLHQSCCEQLDLLSTQKYKNEETAQERVLLAAKDRVQPVFRHNKKFFSDLLKKLKNPIEKSAIAVDLSAEKSNPDNFYPFYTHRLVLEVMRKMLPDPTTLTPIEEEYKFCVTSMESNTELSPLTIENPPLDHPMIASLRLALDQLSNIQLIRLARKC